MAKYKRNEAKLKEIHDNFKTVSDDEIELYKDAIIKKFKESNCRATMPVYFEYPFVFETLKIKYNTDNLSHLIHILEYGVPEQCEFGNTYKFANYKKGYRFCKPKCNCWKKNQSKKITENWKDLSDEDRKDHVRKTEEGMLRIHGVRNAMELPDSLDKIKDKMLKNHGVEHYSQLPEWKLQVSETSLRKRGVEWHTQDPKVKEKNAETNIFRYGGIMTNARKQLKILFRKGNYFATDEWSKKRETIYLLKLGATHPLKSQEILERRKQKYIDTTKRNCHTQSHYTNDGFIALTNKSILEFYIEFYTVVELESVFNCDNGVIYRKVKDYGIKIPVRHGSSYEMIFQNFLIKHSIPFERNNKSILSGKHIDFYLPEQKIAIEINGLYWHSEIIRNDPRYHFNKWKTCNDAGIELYSIFEDDFINNKEMWMNKILHLCNKSVYNKIHARNCEIEKITDEEKSNFLSKNHIQGNSPSSIKLGLYYNDELVSIMTFSNTRNNKDNAIELSRFCNKLNTQVVGGASKLLSYFLKNYNNSYSEIISFSDNSYSDGKLYEKLGFYLLKNINPDYKYVVNGKRVHKANFKKSQIKNKFDIDQNTIDSHTEKELMSLLGYNRIWDCGKKKWKLDLT